MGMQISFAGLNYLGRASPLLIAMLVSAADVNSVSAVDRQRAPAAKFPQAPIQTDSEIYTVERTAAGYTVTIPFIYTNTTNGKVYLPTCRGVHPPMLEKWTTEAWRRVREKWMQGDWTVAFSPVVPPRPAWPILLASSARFLNRA